MWCFLINILAAGNLSLSRKKNFIVYFQLAWSRKCVFYSQTIYLDKLTIMCQILFLKENNFGVLESVHCN
jgi:hypothetical protein